MAMSAKGLTPILNVSEITQSFAWFERLGWKKPRDWGDTPSFGAVGSGASEIFLCQGAQGGRGNGGVKSTFGGGGSETADKGVWMAVWVGDVDAIHRHCLERGLDVAFPPTDIPRSGRQMHLRHPDGHVFRVSQGIKDAE
jgi:hypothetical protein